MPASLKIINQAAQKYFAAFDKFAQQHDLPNYTPATIGWKVTDIEEFNNMLGSFMQNDVVNQCHIGFVDQRYIASIVFKEALYGKIRILKLMQRRPGSTDPVGLDHADFAVDSLAATEAQLSQQSDIKWSHEHNEVHGWISVWFSGREAKLVDHIVLDVGIKELQDSIQQLGFEPKTV